MKTEIIKIVSLEGIPFYRVKEIVTSQGHYITWPGLFESKQSAQKEIENEINRYKKRKIVLK